MVSILNLAVTRSLLCTVLYILGPYYKYRTYYDMLHNEHAHLVPTLSPLLSHLKIVPFVAAGFLLASHYFSIQVSTNDCLLPQLPSVL